jgi:peptidylprolyl isomerase
MTEARNGDTVRVHYKGTLDDGTVFDASAEREPLEFRIGERRIIPGFEQAVVGMNPGESRRTKIPAGEAYGPHREDLVLVVERDQVPEHLDPQVGQQLQIRRPDSEAFVVTVTEISESQVTLDANHPLAGQDLTFEIELVEVL